MKSDSDRERLALESIDEVVIRPVSDIKAKPIEWLWPGYLAKRMLHVLAGRPGAGKSTIMYSMAATVSRGGTWPDGTQSARGSVLVWSGEDATAEVIVPRLHAMCADGSRVHIIDAVLGEYGRRSFDPGNDLSLLEQWVERIGDVSLLLIDPLVAAVGSDSHKNAETRKDLQPLVDFAQDCGVCVLGNTHFTKGTRGRDPLERVTGSLAFGALARVVLGAAKDDEGRGVFARVKSNIGPDGGGFEYGLRYAEFGAGIMGSRIHWGEALTGSAAELLGSVEADDDFVTDIDEASEWLKATLESGRMETKELQKLADQAGFKWHTVKRARKKIGALAKKDGMRGGWAYVLPDGTFPKGNSDGTGGITRPEGYRSKANVPFGGADRPKPSTHEAFTVANTREKACSLRTNDLATKRTPEDKHVPFDETPATYGYQPPEVPEGNNAQESAPFPDSDPSDEDDLDAILGDFVGGDS